jgi:cupin fold WbuC family metalloprotein
MIPIDEKLLQHLIEQARQSPRKRMNYNLHEHLDDKVQRLLNALEPGTVLPIHRHPHTAETYLLLKGELNVLVYNDNKQLIETVLLSQEQQNYGLHIPAGTWHTVEVIRSAVILEIKEGPYCPLSEEDILA